MLRFVRIDYADRDELTPALTRTWNKRLAEHGFQRVGRRDLQSFSNGIVRLFNFQISARGSRDFCVNAAACTLCGNEHPVLQPGFRLRNQNGGDMWLGASTTETAAISVEIAWEAAEAQALPWLEQNATLAGHLEILRAETWSSRHHLLFQIGIVEAMLGQRDNAAKNLTEASRLYSEDGRNWCLAYIEKAKALIDALKEGNEGALVEQWRAANLAVHRVKIA